MKKHSTLDSNTSSFNGCLRSTCVIVTKLVIDSVNHQDNENPRGSTLLHLPYRYWSEISSRVRIWRASQHTPTSNSRECPPRITKFIIWYRSFSDTKIPWYFLTLPNRYWSEIWSRVRIWRVGRHTPTTNYKELLGFIVTPFKIDQNENQNRWTDKVQNLENERR